MKLPRAERLKQRLIQRQTWQLRQMGILEEVEALIPTVLDYVRRNPGCRQDYLLIGLAIYDWTLRARLKDAIQRCVNVGAIVRSGYGRQHHPYTLQINPLK